MKTTLLLAVIALMILSACEISVYENTPQSESVSAPTIDQIEMVPNPLDSTIRVRMWVRSGKIDDPELWDAAFVDSCRVRSDSSDWLSLASDPSLPDGASTSLYKFSGTLRVDPWYPPLLYGVINPKLYFYTFDNFGKADSFSFVVPMRGDTLKRYSGLGNTLM